ncbi:MAG TPA: CmpA/NrtA family ABC transporter substrate-binding protein [Chthoniobacterales bacterium]
MPTPLTFGIAPLTDSAPFVIARTEGFFAQFGIEPTIRVIRTWSAMRDELISGRCHAAHMLFGMPVANAVGRLGLNSKPLIIPWIISRNGQAITLHKKYAGKIKTDAGALKGVAHEKRDKGRPLVFGVTLPVGTHAMWLRYWLASGLISPDNDVALITIPPPQMVTNMRMGNLDGFCAGEPLNARAIADSVGFTAITTQQIWAGHPEKVCVFTEEFAEANPDTVKAVLKALHLASQWLSDPANRDKTAEILSQPEYIGGGKDTIAQRLNGSYPLGDGRSVENDVSPLTFSGNGANYPQLKYAIWWLTQMRRWNMTLGSPDYTGIPARVMRPELYQTAMQELGVPPAAQDFSPETLFDGAAFDPAKPEEYARSFKIHSIRTE